jgi:hypothetical protein
MTEYGVVLFHSTSHALRAEKMLVQAGFKIKMIPTPRQLSSDCGLALRFDRSDQGRIAATLDQNRVPISGIHTI